MRHVIVALASLGLVACAAPDSDTAGAQVDTELSSDGNQTGQSTYYCGPYGTQITLAVDEVTPLGFSVADFLATSGEVDADLSWADGAASRITVGWTVPEGARITYQPRYDVDCPDVVQVDAQMTVTTEDGALEGETTGVYLDVYAPDVATAWFNLDAASIPDTLDLSRFGPVGNNPRVSVVAELDGALQGWIEVFYSDGGESDPLEIATIGG